MQSNICPLCGRVEPDPTAKFCDVDGAKLLPNIPPKKGRDLGSTLMVAAGLLCMGLAGWVVMDLGSSISPGGITVSPGWGATPLPAARTVPDLLRQCYGTTLPPLPQGAKGRAGDVFHQSKDALRMGLNIGKVATGAKISLQDEIRYGREVEAELIKKYKRSKQRSHRLRVEAEAKRLIPLTSRRDELNYHFTVLASKDVNALMTSGGRGFIFEGLLKAMPDDNNLNFVIGHELAHGELGHSTNQLELILAGKAMAETLFGEEAGELGEGMSAVGSKILTSAYDQDQEYEADRLGLCLAYLAGTELSSGFGAMDDLSAAAGGRAVDPGVGGQRIAYDILTSHPPTADRKAYLKKLVGRIEDGKSR